MQDLTVHALPLGSSRRRYEQQQRAVAAASSHQILTGLWLCGLSHRPCLQLTSKSLSHGQMKGKRALVVVATTEQLWNYFNRSFVTVVCACECVCVHTHPQPSHTAPDNLSPGSCDSKVPSTFLFKASVPVLYSYLQGNACHSEVPIGLAISPAGSLCLSL